MRSRSLNFAIAIVLRSFDQMVIADRDLDREKKIAIDDQKITDHSCIANRALEKVERQQLNRKNGSKSIRGFLVIGHLCKLYLYNIERKIY